MNLSPIHHIHFCFNRLIWLSMQMIDTIRSMFHQPASGRLAKGMPMIIDWPVCHIFAQTWPRTFLDWQNMAEITLQLIVAIDSGLCRDTKHVYPTEPQQFLKILVLFVKGTCVLTQLWLSGILTWSFYQAQCKIFPSFILKQMKQISGNYVVFSSDSILLKSLLNSVEYGHKPMQTQCT